MRNFLRPARHSSALLTALCAVGALCVVVPSLAMAQANYSRNCKPAGGVYISDGTYDGTFETTLTASFSEEGISISQEIHLSGKFTLTVDRAAKARGTLTGEVASDFKMKGMGQGISMPAQAVGKMSLALTSLEDDSFSGMARMVGSGTVSARGQDVNVAQPISWDKNSTMTFTAKHATCDVVDGTLRIAALDVAATTLEADGAKVSRTPIVWTMKNKVSMADREKRLRDELAQAAQGATDTTRDAVSTRLGQVADRNDIRKSDCLYKIWKDFVVQLSTAWAQADTASLKTYNGDYAGIAPIIQRALTADKALSLLGMDKCSEAVHTSLFSAIEDALSRLLDRMLKANAPAEDILKVLKNASVVGEVSPALNKRAMDRVMKTATDAAEAAYQKLAAALKAAAGKKDSPGVVAAAKDALAAEKQCIAVGAPVTHSAQQLMGS